MFASVFWLMRLLRKQLLFAGLVLLALPINVLADADVRQSGFSQGEQGTQITGYFSLTLSPALQGAVERGIPLVFMMETEIRRPRWYWLDEAVFQAQLDRRLSYNALVRNYRVSEGAEGRNFANLQDALVYVSRPVSFVVSPGLLRSGEIVDVVWRFRLDPAFLPRPFQVVSFGDRDWRLDSDRKIFQQAVPSMTGGR